MMNLPDNQLPTVSHHNPVAYFSAEFGFDPQLPIYAGGLGVLSGDTILQAADDNFPMIGIGLLYRGFGMRQRIDEHGNQIDEDWNFDPLSAGLEHVYVDELPLFVKVRLTETEVWLRCWKKTFKNGVVLYLLDSETDQNQLPERSITQILYSGTQESQLKQMFLLGIGGVKLLAALNIHPSIYHLNEGRPAFLHWQLIRQLMDHHGIDYYSAQQIAIQKTVYTNHTLVAAGNMGYPMEMVGTYSKYYAQKMNISLEELLSVGIETDPQTFAITRFALNVSKKANGVSQLHSRLSEDYWPQYHWTNVTNGVHFPSWQSSAVPAAGSDPAELWQAHHQEKVNLANFVHQQTGFGFDPNLMIITWARRLAGYKQLQLLFADVERLRRILKNQERPVQLLISGKAHMGDTAGKSMLKEIIHYLSRELAGNALYIPNYNIEIAAHLVKGSDLWLNTPQLGKEASGTSGMKSAANGGLQCTVPDGWAAEVDWKDLGWTLHQEHIAEHVYQLLETEIVPLYYDREDGLPKKWIDKMFKNIKMAERFSAKRMLQEYAEKLYQ